MIALVTGASSGIGRDIATVLASKGYDIIAVARNREKLEQIKEKIETEYKRKVDIKICELTDRKALYNLHEEICEIYGTIDILVNNAGFGLCGKFTQTSLEKEISMIDTNITAYHILTKLFLQDMVKVDKGHILNVASIAGFMPGPLMATYYSTKSYVVRLTQSIRKELTIQKSKVKIHALCPGPVKTNFNKVAEVKFNIAEADSMKVAKYAVKKMLKNRLLIFPGIGIWITRLGAKILPDQFIATICYFVQTRKID